MGSMGLRLYPECTNPECHNPDRVNFLNVTSPAKIKTWFPLPKGRSRIVRVLGDFIYKLQIGMMEFRKSTYRDRLS